MKTLLLSTLAVLVLSSQVQAGKPIARCVSANGELTFTDVFCVTDEPGDNPLLMTESATTPSVRTTIPSVVRAQAIASSELKSATSEAQNQCEKQFTKFFRRKHPGISSIPDVQFSEVVDQFKKGPKVSVSLSAAVEYTGNSETVYSNVECTVQRFKEQSDWIVGFREW